jgi:hypothetical protein
VQNLAVDPSYLDKLRASLADAGKELESAFNAPSAASFGSKLRKSHGLTAFGGCGGLMQALDENRSAAQTHLRDCLKACDEALQNAKRHYLATDEAERAVLSKQIDARS